MKIIALEEHYLTQDVVNAWVDVPADRQDPAVGLSSASEILAGLLDIGEARLRAMDDAGVDIQMLSLTTPAVQLLDPARSVALARASNDHLAEVIRQHPDRFQGFATLPVGDPDAAAKELVRAVCELGLSGAMLHGGAHDRPLDDPAFTVMFDAAARLHAPLYLHPRSPPQDVRKAYYSGFGDELDTMFATAGIGWHYQAGIEAVRLVLAGTFDRHPDLHLILGHWGELVLFYLERIDLLTGFARKAAALERPISEYFRSNVSVTPSGVFSQRYLRWAYEVLGADRIMFSVDHPFVPAGKGAARRFIDEADLTETDKTKIASGNWARLRARIKRSDD